MGLRRGFGRLLEAECQIFEVLWVLPDLREDKESCWWEGKGTYAALSEVHGRQGCALVSLFSFVQLCKLVLRHSKRLLFNLRAQKVLEDVVSRYRNLATDHLKEFACSSKISGGGKLTCCIAAHHAPQLYKATYTTLAFARDSLNLITLRRTVKIASTIRRLPRLS